MCWLTEGAYFFAVALRRARGGAAVFFASAAAAGGRSVVVDVASERGPGGSPEDWLEGNAVEKICAYWSRRHRLCWRFFRIS
jgi:hypothetical protein